MTIQKKNMKEAPVLIPVSEFLESYNKNMPAGWPRATAALYRSLERLTLRFLLTATFGLLTSIAKDDGLAATKLS